ncbi:flagellar biosynthesis regulatory protein FlaF [Methylopila jiangsuensis]|uniref:Flagellar biosynthesis regulatory protein FlaF n=2 Tax=Methylopila jiangsuensis TaxID=586230 RepID=A0A9W6JIS4_9HYPH|nr:flagellar biosynthesis regulatory protein FlaF [Methylopila jiangsuensis]
MQSGAHAYARMAQQTANPREREAQLLLRAAARFAAVQAAESFDRSAAREAALFNRKLWTVFLSSVLRKENPLDADTKTNIKKIAMFVLDRCAAIELRPAPEQMTALIRINRNLAEGLRGG